jgi:hypothetical protein
MRTRWGITRLIKVVGLVLLRDQARSIQQLYAWGVVSSLEDDRAKALKSDDVPNVASKLYYVVTGSNTKQTARSYLDQICNLQRASVTRDIISHLRQLTGEDLGPLPQPWIKKYYAGQGGLGIAETGSPATRGQPIRPDINSTSSAAASRRSP